MDTKETTATPEGALLRVRGSPLHSWRDVVGMRTTALRGISARKPHGAIEVGRKSLSMSALALAAASVAVGTGGCSSTPVGRKGGGDTPAGDDRA
jgi:hypothetical protein